MLADPERQNDGSRLKPCETVVQREQQSHDVENNPSRRGELLSESDVRLGAASQLVNLAEIDDEESGNKNTRKLAHHEKKIALSLEPPRGWYFAVIEFRLVRPVSAHLSPQGIRID